MNRLHHAMVGAIPGVFVIGVLGCAGSSSLSTSGGRATAEASTFSVDAGDGRGKSMALGELHLAPEACAGIDLHPIHEGISVDDLAKFLDARGLSFEKTRAREDLHYFDIQRGQQRVRLRVATLDSPRAAGRDLHEAMLEHGMGSWGVHRSNLAVLGPVSTTEDTVAFAVETKLACWGVLSIAGRDDNFVVPGGYTEL